MWKPIVLTLLFLLVGLPVLMEVADAAEGSGLGWLALLAVAGALFHQHRQLAALRRSVDSELAALRQRVDDLRGESRSVIDEAAIAQRVADRVRDAAVLERASAREPGSMAEEMPEPASAQVPERVPEGVTQEAPEDAPAQALEPLPEPEPEPASAARPMRGSLPGLAAGRVAPLPDVDEWSRRVTASATASLAAWFKGGNTIVRVAVLVLFVGVAFLLRYAVDHDMLPIEWRLAAVAAGGTALLLVGWRLRLRRRSYGLTLQGAGIGVLYMTVYAAMRLYALVPPTLALGSMVVIAGLAAALALWQNALPMAVVAFVGGFAAPLLTAGEAGNHVLLFGYCLVLNLAIAWIASRKAWKLLNLVGFACTSLVAYAWGAAAWRTELLASTEAFLVAHLALYLYITLQYSRQLVAEVPPAVAVAGGPAAAPLPYVDGGLVFGVPLVAAAFQAVLVRHVPYALAVSAAVMSGIYLLLGRWLWRRAGERLRLLTEGLLALGAVFLGLVAPLALDARWTAAAWAVQGAGMVWVALRQRRAWALHFGLALQPLAALSFWSSPLPDAGQRFVANASFTGFVVMAASALACARWLQRACRVPTADPQEAASPGFRPALLQWLHWAAIGLALLHLLSGAYLELARAPWAVPHREQSWILWAVVLALALELAHRRLAWPELAVPARPLLGLAALLSLAGAADAVRGDAGWLRLWPAGLAEVVVLLLAAVWLLRRLDAPTASADAARGHHAAEALGMAWYAMAQGALAVLALAVQFVGDHRDWAAGGVIVVPTLIAWLVLSGLDHRRWPMDRHGALWLAGLAWPWMAMLVAWSAAVNLFGDGSMRPLPYLPLVNPVDLGHGLMLLYALKLRRSMRNWPEPLLAPQLQLARPWLAPATAAVAFWWLTSALVRSLHHWAGTPMWGAGTLDSGLVQTGLSILWTLLALATMFLATRRAGGEHARTVWLAGGVLLAVVVAKLMLVDLSQTSALQRIVSFVGVGLLMLVVGYVAPIPPQRAAPAVRHGS